MKMHDQNKALRPLKDSRENHSPVIFENKSKPKPRSTPTDNTIKQQATAIASKPLVYW